MRLGHRATEISPSAYARTAGILVLVILGCAGVGMMYVPSTLLVPGDAAATADNIRASKGLFRLGMVADAALFLTEIVLVVVLYRLFEPVSRTLSLIAAYARLTMTVIQGVNLLNSMAVLLVLSGAAHLAVFEPAQLDALALLFVDARPGDFHLGGVLRASLLRAWLPDLHLGLRPEGVRCLDGAGGGSQKMYARLS